MNEPVPVLPLGDIYSSHTISHQTPRYLELENNFEKKFSSKPQFIARAPGRVNMIGEHIDYVGYSVFPLAIERDILMAVTFEPGSHDLEVHLENESSRFSRSTFHCDLANPNTIELVHSGNTRWANYFKVAMRGLSHHLPSDILSKACGVLKVLVTSDLPPENGLSSSAALTICSIIAVVTAIGARERVSRGLLTDITISSERLVGVNSGGMDQAASMFGVKGCAVSIGFVPELKITPIPLPASEDYVFLVTNTMVASDKKVMGPVQYNLRVVETQLAARVMEKKLNIDAEIPQRFRHTLRAVSDTYWETYPEKFDEMIQQFDDVKAAFDDCGWKAARMQAMLNLVEQNLPRRGLTREEVEDLVGVYGVDFEKKFLKRFPVKTNKFYLHARAFHAYSEALRVIQFRTICERANEAIQRGEEVDVHRIYHRLGAIMNGSHESVRVSYECSSPELNMVVHLARQNGALGSRLTGAGWGGCAVSLVPKAKEQAVISAVRHTYFGQRFGYLTPAELDANMFTTHPSQGACIIMTSPK